MTQVLGVNDLGSGVVVVASFEACAGSGMSAVSLERYPSQRDGLGMTRAKTFGKCPACGRVVMSYGLVNAIRVTRHKAEAAE